MSTSTGTNGTPSTSSAQRALTFQNANNAADVAGKTNFEKSIQERLKILQALLPDYTAEVDINEYVEELRSVCENSGLDKHRGLIVTALMKKCELGSYLGRRIRASLTATKQAIIQDHVAAGGTEETANTSRYDNKLAVRYLDDIFNALGETAAECTETNMDLKLRWRELRMLDSESLVEYFDRAQELLILLQERGINYGKDDIAMDVLQGLRARTDKAGPTFYTTLALLECKSLSDLRIRAKNLHRVMAAGFTDKIPLSKQDRVTGEEAVRRAGLGATEASAEQASTQPQNNESVRVASSDSAQESSESVETPRKFVPSDFVKPCKSCLKKGLPADRHSWAFCKDNPGNIFHFTEGYGQRGPNKRSTPAEAPLHSQQNKRIKDMRRVKCYNCNEMGHISRNCPKKNTNQSAQDDRAALMQEARQEVLKEQAAELAARKQRQTEMAEVVRMALAQAKSKGDDSWPPSG